MKSKENRILKIYGWAAFLNDFGSDIIYPLWPIYLTSVLKANMAVLGFIDGLGDTIVSLSQALSGYLAEKTGKRKIFIWLGYLFGGISRLGYALSPSWHWIVPLRILDRSGKIRGAPRDAEISDISTDSNRGKNFGFLRMMDNLGAVCGICFTLLFFPFLGYTKLFLLAAIPSFIGAYLIKTYIQDQKSNNNKIFRGIQLKNFTPEFRLFLFTSSIFSLASFSYSFLLIATKTKGIGVIFIPFLYLIFTFVASAFSLPFGKLADATSRKFVLKLSFIFWILVCVVFLSAKNFLMIVLGFILYGMHKGALEPVQKTLVSELAEPELRASSLGGFQMVIGFFALPSSLLAGILWEKIGMKAPFYFSLILTVISFLLLLFVKERRNIAQK